MFLFKKIETVNDIKTAALVYSGGTDAAREKFIADALNPECTFFRFTHKEAEALSNSIAPDVIFIFSEAGRSRDKQFSLCQMLRSKGDERIIIFVANKRSDIGDSPLITSKGFDNYLVFGNDKSQIHDTIQWAILNRRRRNKFSLQFDDNPDKFFTVDGKGKVYDLNEGAANGSSYSPKEIVNNGISASELETLRCFEKVIQPLICENNVNKEFSNTIEEGEAVAQIRTKIHNVPTIGLVATVVKTDITKAMYSNTMNILINSVTLLSHRDNYTASHSARVFYYCSYIAEYMKPSEKRNFFRDLYLASILHDIGKIGVRDSVLLKPGKLEQVEFDYLATHPVKGYDLLQNYIFLKGAGELVRAHHERPDGKGYPDGLTEEKTPLGAYIISVADSFDAMTSSRPYRTAMDYDDAVREIRNNLGHQYHYAIGKAFLEIITPALVNKVLSNSQKPLSEISEEILGSLLNTEVQSNDDL